MSSCGHYILYSYVLRVIYLGESYPVFRLLYYSSRFLVVVVSLARVSADAGFLFRFLAGYGNRVAVIASLAQSNNRFCEFQLFANY